MQAAYVRLRTLFSLTESELRLLLQLTLSGLALLVIVFLALSIKVETQGKNFQTSQYTFEFLGGLKDE